MAGINDLLQGRANPMDLRSLAGKMGMASQFQTAGGPVQNTVGMPPLPGGMDMMGPMGAPMQGGPPPPGPMGGPGMQGMPPGPMGGMGAPPPSEVSPESGIGLQTLLEFSKLEDQDIIQLVMVSKPREEVPETLLTLGEQLGRPMLVQAGQELLGAVGGGGLESELQGMGEGMVG